MMTARLPHILLLMFFSCSAFCVSTATMTRNQELLNLIAGSDENKQYLSRAAAIRKLNDYLTAEEIVSAKKFLYEKKTTLKNLEFNSLKNDLVVILMRQKKPVGELGSWLVEMYGDREFGDTWRDYCIQFIGQLYMESDSELKAKMLSALNEALKERNNGIAGAAMIAMNRNIMDATIDKTKLAKTAYDTATAKDSPDYLKATAIQIAASNKETRILDVCEKILIDNEAKYPVQLKISALAAIGILQDKTKLEILKKYSKSSDIRLTTSAKTAIEKIEIIK